MKNLSRISRRESFSMRRFDESTRASPRASPRARSSKEEKVTGSARTTASQSRRRSSIMSNLWKENSMIRTTVSSTSKPSRNFRMPARYEIDENAIWIWTHRVSFCSRYAVRIGRCAGSLLKASDASPASQSRESASKNFSRAPSREAIK